VLDIFYHPIYVYGIDENSRFPRDRYHLTKNRLNNFSDKIVIREPKMIDIKDIYLAHDKKYVDSFLNGQLSIKEKRKIGLQPWNEYIIERTKFIMGGSMGALESAIDKNSISANMAGGTHHAHYSFGSGYCIFNDLAICAIKSLNNYSNINNVLIIDLDVHQGDGTASIFKKNSSVFTLSMHCNSNFPLKKMNSDIDIPLRKGMKDDQYLEILRNQIGKLNNIKSDIIFFQAGVDTLKEDKIGHLSLTNKGLQERNKIVLDFAKKRHSPIVVFMGGGYSKPIDYSVSAFVDLFLQCSDYLNLI
tara:strand:- start:57 stop:965 length:909 start_codon:yes stop_codon:yes gene_type:complete